MKVSERARAREHAGESGFANEASELRKRSFKSKGTAQHSFRSITDKVGGKGIVYGGCMFF